MIQELPQRYQNVIQTHSTKNQTFTNVTYQQNYDFNQQRQNLNEDNQTFMQQMKENQLKMQKQWEEDQTNLKEQQKLFQNIGQNFLEYQKNPNSQSEQEFYRMAQQFMQNQQKFNYK